MLLLFVISTVITSVIINDSVITNSNNNASVIYPILAAEFYFSPLHFYEEMSKLIHLQDVGITLSRNTYENACHIDLY